MQPPAMTRCDAKHLPEGAIDDGCRGTTLAPKLARGGGANAQAQRHPPGALRSRPRADDADQEHPRRSVLHLLPHLSLIHISEPTRRTPISYAVFCLKKKKTRK